MTREEMLTEMIRMYGFEHPCTIAFVNAFEYASDETLRQILEEKKKEKI